MLSGMQGNPTKHDVDTDHCCRYSAGVSVTSRWGSLKAALDHVVPATAAIWCALVLWLSGEVVGLT